MEDSTLAVVLFEPFCNSQPRFSEFRYERASCMFCYRSDSPGNAMKVFRNIYTDSNQNLKRAELFVSVSNINVWTLRTWALSLLTLKKVSSHLEPGHVGAYKHGCVGRNICLLINLV